MKRRNTSLRVKGSARPRAGALSKPNSLPADPADRVNEAIIALRDLTLDLRRMLGLRTAAE
jgi:hypothetical protein